MTILLFHITDNMKDCQIQEYTRFQDLDSFDMKIIEANLSKLRFGIHMNILFNSPTWKAFCQMDATLLFNVNHRAYEFIKAITGIELPWPLVGPIDFIFCIDAPIVSRALNWFSQKQILGTEKLQQDDDEFLPLKKKRKTIQK